MIWLEMLFGVSVVLNVGLFVAGYGLFNENERLSKQLFQKIKSSVETDELVKKLKSELNEHDIIFDKLEEDPEYLVKALNAYNEVYYAVRKEYGFDSDVLEVLEYADVKCNTVYKNEYEPRINLVTISLFNDYDDEGGRFLFDYVNNKFGTNLKCNDIRTNIIFTTLHELGHSVDYNFHKSIGNDEYLTTTQLLRRTVHNMPYGPEQWEAYREMVDESYADKFAIDFMLKHFPELC